MKQFPNHRRPSPVPSHACGPEHPSARRPEKGEGRRMTDLVYGRRPVWEAFRAGKRSLHKVWMVAGTAGGVVEDILVLARERGVPIEWVPRDRLNRMVHGNHQGVAAQVSATTYLELDDFLGTLTPTPSPTGRGEGEGNVLV